ncbi:hypothetical protein BDY19DRAFT_976378 [Irpex rosettiformis]|uniref:Uncharacterized protein n=1 Tax=Irpex rosettiformis TaxID=378272 RepID=A0ACB8TNX6_9APHY|nr:hypothetical protein BDY19DRAFT_976378 [Irpex rosettiformis]
MDSYWCERLEQDTSRSQDHFQRALTLNLSSTVIIRIALSRVVQDHLPKPAMANATGCLVRVTQSNFTQVATPSTEY